MKIQQAMMLILGCLLPAAAHTIGEHEHGTRPSVEIMIPVVDEKRQEAEQPAPGSPAFMASVFAPFAPKVKTRTDERFLYVESDSMPAHRMMVGITAWQQQVPLPKSYTGGNAWRIPLRPVVAKEPMSAKTNFFRGAIALAANGVPIFNPIKNDGRTDTFLAGELDDFGGHCGRGDDYHYHIAPLHLQKQTGNGKPVAYALDGYAIYGLTEPDGSPAGELDKFNGHSTPELGYHYHATKTYPYLNGGFHGEVVERDGQVDPQPRAGGMRPHTPPLRGAKITGFTAEEGRRFSVKYEISGKEGFVNYALNDDGSVSFEFISPGGETKKETYSPRQRGVGKPGGRDRPDLRARDGERPRPGDGRGRPDRKGSRNQNTSGS